MDQTKTQPQAASENDLFGRLDIRIGKVLTVKEHPDADSLYVEEIDVGEDTPRTIVSGLRKFVPITEFVEKFVLVLCNLPPRKMRGIMSNGMVLCASKTNIVVDSVSASETTTCVVELLEPDSPERVVPGERVVITGQENSKPDPVLKPKEKIWEKCEEKLKSRSGGGAPVAAYNECVLISSKCGALFLPLTLKEYVVS